MLHSRRSFLKAAGGTAAYAAAYVGTKSYAQSSISDAPYADKEAADEWIQQWMQAPGSVSSPLHLGRFADRTYFLTEEIGWSPNPGQQAPNVRVPVGFVTDFASIPRAFWSLFPPDSLYTYPAILHDYLYWEKPVIRSQADLIFRYAMEDLKIDTVTTNVIYSGVRLGGGFAWRGNAARKQSGEKRILKVYPTDPTVRWAEWKLKPGVF